MVGVADGISGVDATVVSAGAAINVRTSGVKRPKLLSIAIATSAPAPTMSEYLLGTSRRLCRWCCTVVAMWFLSTLASADAQQTYPTRLYAGVKNREPFGYRFVPPGGAHRCQRVVLGDEHRVRAENGPQSRPERDERGRTGVITVGRDSAKRKPPAWTPTRGGRSTCPLGPT